MSSEPGALIHTADVAGSPVRFFRSPLPGDDLPWHALEDLWTAAGLPQAVRRESMVGLQQEWKDDVRAVCLDGVSLVIAPHWIAQGFTQAHDGYDDGGPLFVAYCRGAIAANRAMAEADGLTPLQAFSRTLRAAVRGEGQGNVH